MARSKKYEKNLTKVQSMLDGEFNRKIQSGYTPGTVKREVGDIWTDADDIKWEQKKGYKMKITKTANVGVFKYQCKDCDTACIKSFDVDTYKRMGRCYHCQIEFEENLKYGKDCQIGENNNKHFFWVKLQELLRWKAMDKDAEQLIDDWHEQNKRNPFDERVANAIGNEELSMKFHKGKVGG